MSETKRLTVLERALIRDIKNQINESVDLGEAPEAASWTGEGILLSREEAEYILSMIPGAEDVAL